MFAEDYPRFMEVSELVPKPERMNERYEARSPATGTSSTGRGCSIWPATMGDIRSLRSRRGVHVTGVEVRESLVHQSQQTFAFYGQDPETYRFVCGDVFEVLAREKFDVDVVLCLGYLYHTYRHTELMYRLHGLAPKHLIVDTMVVPGSRRILRVFPERSSEAIRSAAQDAYPVGRVLVAWPSMPALQLLLAAYGFEIESRYNWKARLAGRPPTLGLTSYAKGTRVTLRCRSREAAMAPGWEPVAFFAPPVGPQARGRKRTTTPPPAQLASGWRAGQQDADQGDRLRAAASLHQRLRARPGTGVGRTSVER